MRIIKIKYILLKIDILKNFGTSGDFHKFKEKISTHAKLFQ